jgi:hypothetical protein
MYSQTQSKSQNQDSTTWKQETYPWTPRLHSTSTSLMACCPLMHPPLVLRFGDKNLDHDLEDEGDFVGLGDRVSLIKWVSPNCTWTYEEIVYRRKVEEIGTMRNFHITFRFVPIIVHIFNSFDIYRQILSTHTGTNTDRPSPSPLSPSLHNPRDLRTANPLALATLLRCNPTPNRYHHPSFFEYIKHLYQLRTGGRRYHSRTASQQNFVRSSQASTGGPRIQPVSCTNGSER